MDDHKNLAYSTLAGTLTAVATSCPVQAGHGTRFPVPPFNCTIWPAAVVPTPDNAEIVRVTAIATDTLTITRGQEGTTAKAFASGDQIANTITDKVITDIEAAIPELVYNGDWSAVTPYQDGDVVVHEGVSYLAVQPSTNEEPFPWALPGAGLVGPAGLDGDAWIYGTGAPAPSADRVGTLYLDGTTGNVYEQQGGGWVFTGISIKGPAGSTGSQGSQGPAGPTNPWQMGQTWAIIGPISATTLPGIFVPKLGTQTITLKGVRAKLVTGTSVAAQLRRNGSNLGSAISVTSTAATTAFNQALSADDLLDFVLTAPTGSPDGISLTAYLEHLVA